MKHKNLLSQIDFKRIFENFEEDKPKPTDTVYVLYMDSKNNFKKTKKYFANYEEAKKWCIKTMDKFDPDYIHYIK
jgi:oligoendopeptidase F